MNTGLISRIDRAGPALMALVIAVVAVVYVSTAYFESSRIHNVIFIIPMAAIAVTLAAIVLLRVIARARAAQAATASPAEAEADSDEPAVSGLGVAAMMALLVAYAFSIPWIGFDVASILFMAGCLWIQGERRPLVVVAMSLIFSLGVTWLLINGARVPAHTLLF